jgi:hypothetical protein
MNRTNLVEDLTLLTVPPWWQSPWALVAFLALLLALGLLVRWLVGRFRHIGPGTPLAPPVPDRHAEFLARLAKLRAERASFNAYALAIAASELLRDYVEWRYRLQIRYQTTREFLEAAVASRTLQDESRSRLGDFLGFCDRVKFARAHASESEGDGLLDAAESFIRSGQPTVGGVS